MIYSCNEYTQGREHSFALSYNSDISYHKILDCKLSSEELTLALEYHNCAGIMRTLIIFGRKCGFLFPALVEHCFVSKVFLLGSSYDLLRNILCDWIFLVNFVMRKHITNIHPESRLTDLKLENQILMKIYMVRDLSKCNVYKYYGTVDEVTWLVCEALYGPTVDLYSYGT